jgi:hypothetical protein
VKLLEKYARNPQIILKWLLKVFRIFGNLFGVCLTKKKIIFFLNEVAKIGLNVCLSNTSLNQKNFIKILAKQTRPNFIDPKPNQSS